MTRERLQWVLALVAVGALSFLGGKQFGPAKVEIREVEKIVKVETAAKVETRVVYRDRVIHVNGTVTEREVERSEAKTETKAETASERSAVRVETKPIDWRVGVLVGAQLAPPAVPIAGPLVLGVAVERRLVGPLWLGAWGTTGGAAGGSLSISF